MGEGRGQVVFDDSVTWTLVRVVSGGEEREGNEGEIRFISETTPVVNGV